MQRPIDLYPARATGVSADYPDGSSKNESAPGANDGTPYDLARANDVFGVEQAMLHQLGIVPSGSAETALVSQFLEGVRRLASKAPAYVDSGIVNAYVLTRLSGLQASTVLYDGMEIEFKALVTSTGAATVNPDGIGATALTYADGTALSGGEVVAGAYTRARYNLANTRFELPQLPSSSAEILQEVISTDKVFASGITPVIPADDTIPQITEGTEFFTAAITPLKSTSVLRVSGFMNVTSGAANGIINLATFVGATVDAIWASSGQGTIGNMFGVSFSFDIPAGSTAARTYRLRMGPTGAGGMSINGATARLFGGVTESWFRVQELG